MILDSLLADLDAESQQLDGWVALLPADGWTSVTTPEGWTVAHQIAHLAWTDEASFAAITDVDEFGRGMKAAAADPEGYVDKAADELVAIGPEQLLVRWRDGRANLSAALRGVPDGEKIPWFGPPMSPASMATARLMETWAHGHDVAEALGITVPRTDRAKHVAYLGVRTRGFAYLVHGRQAPDVDIRVELTGPDGDVWAWGPQDAEQRVTGDGHDFALLATRRRHLDDVDVNAVGADAEDWLTIVQAFAGLPGNPPKRLSERGGA